MIDGLRVVEVKAIADERGVVREIFRASTHGDAFAPVQVNLTQTVRGAIRGMHGETMTKLVGVASGRAFAAWVDARPDSPTVGEVVTRELVPGVTVVVPPGVCNGFQAVADEPTEYLYCFDREWEPGLPGPAVHPLDPALAIPWPVQPVILSPKDAAQPTLAEVLAR